MRVANKKIVMCNFKSLLPLQKRWRMIHSALKKVKFEEPVVLLKRKEIRV
jgi:hypothetical protein